MTITYRQYIYIILSKMLTLITLGKVKFAFSYCSFSKRLPYAYIYSINSKITVLHNVA